MGCKPSAFRDMLVKALIDIRYFRKNDKGQWKILPVNPASRSEAGHQYDNLGQIYECEEIKETGQWVLYPRDDEGSVAGYKGEPPIHREKFIVDDHYYVLRHSGEEIVALIVDVGDQHHFRILDR